MNNSPLHIAAFTLCPEVEQAPLSFAGLQFPHEWHALLMQLQAERRDRVGMPNTAPVRSLNSVLKAFVPHLLTTPETPRQIEPGMERHNPAFPWLLAARPVDVEKVWMVVQAWLERTYHDCDSLPLAQKALRLEDLHWQEHIYPILKECSENGTAQPMPLSWSAFPSLVAEQLADGGLTISVGGEERQLRRVPVQSGAELVTWPPVYHMDGQDYSYGYSYTIAITLQTMVGENHPRFHFHYGIRLWTARPLLDDGKLRLGKNARTVYLHRTLPWLGLNPTTTFATARLRAAYVEGRRIPEWDNLVPDIARRLNVPFPEAEDVLSDPGAWLTGSQGVVAAMVEQSPNRRQHPVQAGMDLETHGTITRLIADHLANKMVLHPPLQRLIAPAKVQKHVLASPLRELAAIRRLDGLERSIGPNITIEIYWNTPTTRDMIADRIESLLCRSSPELVPDKNNPTKRKRAADPPPSSAEDARTIVLPSGGVLNIVPRHLGAFGAPFPLAEQGAPTIKRAEYKKIHTEKRARQICEEMPKLEGAVLALVELPNYQDPNNFRVRQQFGWRDPKQAIRLGMAWAGRVTQFTTGESLLDAGETSPSTTQKEDLRQRCESAVRDGLRHLGYLPEAIGFHARPKWSLPENLLVAAVWQVRLTQKTSWNRVYMPVVVLMHTNVPEVQAWLPDGRGVRPYHQALRDITRIDPAQVKRNRRQETLQALRQFLERDLPMLGTEDILILTAAQNIRLLWEGQQNSEMAQDGMRFERGGYVEPLVNLPGRLRLIRLRTSESRETPEWYTDDATGGNGYTQGVWPHQTNPRLFYNNASKPHTEAQKRKGKQVDPREHYAIPSLLEIFTAVMQPDDKPEVWAKAIDEWRRMGTLLTSDMLRLPLPLSLASRMDDYAEVIGRWAFPDQWGDDDEEENDSEE